jgi:nucleoside-diphosphate-sugar epimerase
MRVFVTGASGWIGSHTVSELLAHGHQVVGLARSAASAASIEAKGAEVLRGDLDDLEAIRRGAAQADGVIHLANKHDFANPAVSNAAERAAALTIGDALAGSGKPFVLAAGIAIPNGGAPLTEDVPNPAHGPDAMRGGSENLALEYAKKGVRAVVTRFAPTVHGHNDHGFVAYLVQSAQKDGVALYAGDGSGRWPAVHVSDAARLVRLGLEKAPAGTVLHAVDEEAVRTGDIAATIGAGLGLPVEPVTGDQLIERYGFVGMIYGLDLPASSARTRRLLDWMPTGPGLLEDLRTGAYFTV